MATPTDRSSNFSGGPSKRTRKIGDIKNKLLRPALTSHYICKFNPPTPVITWTASKGTPFNPNQDLIEISCSEAALPGSSLMTHESNNDFTGVTEKHVYRRAYDQVANFTFMVDHDYTIIKIFENWMSYIVGEQFATEPGILDSSYFYRVRYPEQYTTDMREGGGLYITKFERDYENTGVCLEYKFIKAYPLSIVTMPVRYDASELLKCTVNFTYSRYVINPTETAQQTPQLSGAAQATQRKETTNPVNTNGNPEDFRPSGAIGESWPEPDFNGAGGRVRNSAGTLNDNPFYGVR